MLSARLRELRPCSPIGTCSHAAKPIQGRGSAGMGMQMHAQSYERSGVEPSSPPLEKKDTMHNSLQCSCLPSHLSHCRRKGAGQDALRHLEDPARTRVGDPAAAGRRARIYAAGEDGRIGSLPRLRV